jgi:hypothetical protein
LVAATTTTLLLMSAALVAYVATRASHNRRERSHWHGQAFLNAVSCAPVGGCMAVGQRTAGYAVEPIAERLEGRAWTALPVAAIGRSSQLTGIACAAGNFCIAVGSQPRGGALAEIWRGERWTQQRVPAPPGAPTLAGISCAGPSFCVAVGATELEHTLIERWDGSGWKEMASPGSAGAAAAPLRAVSCVTAGTCVAVGTLFANAAQSSLVDMYRAGGWVRLAGGGAGESPVLNGVSCVPARESSTTGARIWCLAVGSSGVGTERRPLALAIDGTALTSPAPIAARGAAFSGVSCTQVGDCIAVGSVTRESGRAAPFAERLEGSVWTLLSPWSGRTATALTGGVSCLEVSACVAVGSAIDPRDAAIVAASERLDGTRWTAVVTPREP